MASKFQNRLVGAVVMVAVGVIVLPALLDVDKKYNEDQFASIPLVPKPGDEQEIESIAPIEQTTTPSTPSEGASEAMLSEAVTGVEQPAVSTPEPPVVQPVTPQPQPVPEPPVVNPTNPVSQGGNGMPSKLELLNFASVLKGQYPEIAEAIDTGAIYSNMVDMGISLVKDGQFNVDGVIGFAKMQNDQAALRKQLTEATKQPADAQPDATVTIDSTLPMVNSATMTEVQAQNIILLTMQQRKEGKGDHPQFKEAETFIANSARKR